MSKKLIFIYNADSGIGNAVSDSIHKFVNPETYPCDLCALTHGYFREKKERNTFLQSITIPVEFYHKNEIKGLSTILLDSLPPFPCILIVQNKTILRSLSGNDRKSYLTLQSLIDILKEKLTLYTPQEG